MLEEKLSVFPMGEKNDAYARYFVGQSYLKMLTTEGVVIGNVTFEPGCRNNWHIHHQGGQILLVTGGRGYYQEWGKPARELNAGDVVNIPPEVKHWHGAAPDSWFAHLAVEVPAAGVSNSLENLPQELACYGKNVMLVYGGGSIKKNGIYEDVVKLLRASGKTVFEDAGVMPNPTLEKLYEGCRIAKENKVDLILAVGGGSVCDYAKAVSVSAYCETDPWEKYYLRMEAVDNKIIPVGCVLTMVGTGSEMNGGSVITNHAAKAKIGRVFGDNVFPRFSILDPTYTFTLPRYQMVAGFFDIMSHILEQYFSGTDDNTSDYLMEGLLRSLIHSSRIAVQSPEDYEARSNIMWIATWALNTLVAKGKSTDWMVHMIGQSIGAYTDATHGMTLPLRRTKV